MRLMLTLRHSPNSILPKDYEYLISSWIYKTLWQSNTEFATWLHNEGYDFNDRKYKLFTFSELMPERYETPLNKGQFILKTGPSVLILSFKIPDAFQIFVAGLFRQGNFSLGDRRHQVDFSIEAIETLAKPIFQPVMRFRLHKPCLISQQTEEHKYAKYLHPEDADFAPLFFKNLLHKTAAALQPTIPGVKMSVEADADWRLRILSEPKRRMTTIKDTRYIGYKFDFEIAAPPALIETGYFAGFGEKNSNVGFGFVGVLR